MLEGGSLAITKALELILKVDETFCNTAITSPTLELPGL
jgi:hypothetical protein